MKLKIQKLTTGDYAVSVIGVNKLVILNEALGEILMPNEKELRMEDTKLPGLHFTNNPNYSWKKGNLLKNSKGTPLFELDPVNGSEYLILDSEHAGISMNLQLRDMLFSDPGTEMFIVSSDLRIKEEIVDIDDL